MRRADPLEALWPRLLGDGAVVVVGSGVGDGVLAGALCTIEAPPDEATLSAALRTVGDGELDPALATRGWWTSEPRSLREAWAWRGRRCRSAGSGYRARD